MPEILASLIPSFAADAGFDALAGAGAGAATGLGADALGSAAFGGLGDLAAAGLPFAAGAGDLGSVATGAGPAGVTGFLDTAGIGSALGASGLGGVGDLAAAGLPAAAGIGEIGSNVGGAGVDLAALAGDAALPPTAGLTSGSGPVSFGGVTNVGPSAGTPAGALQAASFETAPAVAGGPTGALPAAGPSAAAIAAPTGTNSLDLTSLLSKAGSKIAENPLGLALAAGGLGYNIFKGQGDTAATQRIQAQDANVQKTASDITGQGQALAAHTEAGTLPPAIQQQLDNQIKDAKTKMISTYASNGMNTDPAKNSMLRQELASIDKQGTALKGDLQKQLLASGATLINSGTALTGADNDLIKTLSNIDQKSSERIGTAIANFASALSGKSAGITLNLGNKAA